MKSEKISNSAGALLCVIVSMTNVYSVMSGSDSGNAVWISNLLATVLAFFCTALFAHACDSFPNEPFYNVLIRSGGKTFAGVVGALLTIFTLLTCVISLTAFSRFVQITALPQTPQIILPILCVTVAALALSGGISCISGATLLLFWFIAAVFVIFILSGIPHIYPHILLPQSVSAQKIFSGAGEVFLNRFGQIPAFMAIYTRMSDKKSRKKYMLGSVASSGVVIAAIATLTTATLGTKTASTDFYPVYTAMSLHSVGGFIQHTEILACIAMTLCLFFKAAICLMFSGDILDGIFKIPRRRGVYLPLALISASATQLVYRDISSLRGMLEWKDGAIYVLLLNIIIPLVVFLAARIKAKKEN